LLKAPVAGEAGIPGTVAAIYSDSAPAAWLICDLMQKESDRNFAGGPARAAAN
jgi:hypothetical protein